MPLMMCRDAAPTSASRVPRAVAKLWLLAAPTGTGQSVAGTVPNVIYCRYVLVSETRDTKAAFITYTGGQSGVRVEAARSD